MATTSIPTGDRHAPSERHDDGGRESRVNVGRVERWISLLGGGALVAYGMSRKSWPRVALVAAGGGLISRGATRHCPVYGALGVDTAHADWSHGNVVAAIMPAHSVEVRRAVTVARPRDELFRFWRDFSNLPRFMQHLESVTPIDDTHSHWVTKAPIGKAIEWDAEITDEIENELIAWRSTQDTDVRNSGSVRFRDAPGGRGTEVHVDLRYAAPGGLLGAALAKLFGESPDQQVRDDLRNFKQMMEAGETPTITGQPMGE